MTAPVLMVVDDDPESLGLLDGTLRRRYGQDYLIVSDASPTAALGRLRELQAAGREVAVVMAAATMTAAPATELLAQARGIAPAAKRVLVVPAAGWALQRPQLPLETSLPGVFAAGDVRHGSVKRVASAVGEGSIATTQINQYLQSLPADGT